MIMNIQNFEYLDTISDVFDVLENDFLDDIFRYIFGGMLLY